MLYRDLIELRSKEPGAGSWFTGAARNAHAPVDGHGTGVSTGVGTDARSFAPASAAATVDGSGPKAANPVTRLVRERVAQALSVTGNVLAGALFLGGLYLVPHALQRLTALL